MGTHGEFFGEPRRAEWDGGVYLVRDVWFRPKPRQCAHTFIRCEYATKDEAGNQVWHECAEGVLFADIQPFEKVAA